MPVLCGRASVGPHGESPHRGQKLVQATTIERTGNKITLNAPFAAPGFTLRIAGRSTAPPRLTAGETAVPLREVKQDNQLQPGTWLREEAASVVCFDLAKGQSVLTT